MVYNNPNVTSGITRETMKELYKLPHVKIVKDASMVIDVMTDFIFEAEQAEEEKMYCVDVITYCTRHMQQEQLDGSV